MAHNNSLRMVAFCDARGPSQSARPGFLICRRHEPQTIYESAEDFVERLYDLGWRLVKIDGEMTKLACPRCADRLF